MFEAVGRKEEDRKGESGRKKGVGKNDDILTSDDNE